MSHNAPHRAASRPSDPFFPSGRFAKVPAEALSPMTHATGTGAAPMSHAEFRVFVALCRFRGVNRVVNPSRKTLGVMTGLTPNNISRATKGLQANGWLLIHYLNESEVENYELLSPRGRSRPSRAPAASSSEQRHRPGAGGVPVQDMASEFEVDSNYLSTDELDALLAAEAAAEADAGEY